MSWAPSACSSSVFPVALGLCDPDPLPFRWSPGRFCLLEGQEGREQLEASHGAPQQERRRLLRCISVWVSRSIWATAAAPPVSVSALSVTGQHRQLALPVACAVDLGSWTASQRHWQVRSVRGTSISCFTIPALLPRCDQFLGLNSSQLQIQEFLLSS